VRQFIAMGRCHRCASATLHFARVSLPGPGFNTAIQR
jgi:hypothetical protein